MLLDFINKYKSTIECKKTHAKSSKQKADAWNELCVEFNANSVYTKSEVKNLRNYWKNLKTHAKADAALQRRERIKTEGGPPVKLHPSTELVQSKQPDFEDTVQHSIVTTKLV